MFEESASSLSPTLWESMNSWFTPTVLFVVLNVMIGTIAFTSSLTNQNQKQSQNNNNDTNQEKIIKSPSLIQRLKSINLNTQTTKPTPDSDTLFSSEQIHLTQSLETHFFQNSQNTPDTQSHYIFEQTHEITQSHSKILDSEQPNVDKIESFDSQSMDEVYTQLKETTHFTRTKSDTEPASGDIPVKLPAKMKKSASSKSAFAHFEAKDVIEARRPATVKERGSKITEEDEEVDAKADDFINKFKQQLKLQRLDSIIRYKDMIGSRSGGK